VRQKGNVNKKAILLFSLTLFGPVRTLVSLRCTKGDSPRRGKVAIAGFGQR